MHEFTAEKNYENFSLISGYIPSNVKSLNNTTQAIKKIWFTKYVELGFRSTKDVQLNFVWVSKVNGHSEISTTSNNFIFMAAFLYNHLFLQDGGA